MDDGMRRSITAAAGDDCRVGRFLRFPGRQFPFLRDAAPFPSRFTSIVGNVSLGDYNQGVDVYIMNGSWSTNSVCLTQ